MPVYITSVGHGSYNLEKVLNFISHLEKSLNSVKVLEKYLISLLGLEKSLKFTTLSKPDTFFCIKLDYFDEESWAHPQCKNRAVNKGR